MFIGHFGVALAAKPLAPRVSLGTLFVAAQFIDLLWPTFLLLDLERVRIDPSLPGLTPLVFIHYPITHSLLGTAVWAAVLGGVYLALMRHTRGALVIGGLVVSHWVLDALVHRPDLLLWPGGTMVIGLALWERPVFAIVLELAFFIAGVWLYLHATASVPHAPRWRFWALIAFLLAVHAANLFGPPPPSVQAIAWAAQAQWLIVLLAYWVDRLPRAAPQPARV